MLTARDGEVDKVVGLELGADDYVTKPFSLRELTARIRAIFRRAEQAAADAGRRRRSWTSGASRSTSPATACCATASAVPLKPKAFELLAFLVRNPGQVFTRDQLLERVWGYDYAGETRTVDVHVHWLRARAGGGPGRTRAPPDRPRRGLRVPPARLIGSATDAAPGAGKRVSQRLPLHLEDPGGERSERRHRAPGRRRRR